MYEHCTWHIRTDVPTDTGNRTATLLRNCAQIIVMCNLINMDRFSKGNPRKYHRGDFICHVNKIQGFLFPDK